jgi:hypothetical protein
VLDRCPDTAIGSTDGLDVVLADRFNTDKTATLDRRHYPFAATPSGRSLTLLP